MLLVGEPVRNEVVAMRNDLYETSGKFPVTHFVVFVCVLKWLTESLICFNIEMRLRDFSCGNFWDSELGKI